jgi:hypothetical protein
MTASNHQYKVPCHTLHSLLAVCILSLRQNRCPEITVVNYAHLSVYVRKIYVSWPLMSSNHLPQTEYRLILVICLMMVHPIAFPFCYMWQSYNNQFSFSSDCWIKEREKSCPCPSTFCDKSFIVACCHICGRMSCPSLCRLPCHIYISWPII